MKKRCLKMCGSMLCMKGIVDETKKGIVLLVSRDCGYYAMGAYSDESGHLFQ